jgi:hypothetical protein
LPYHYAAGSMNPVKRLASSLLLAAGMVMVFAGLSAALGFTVPGMLASLAAMTALLYAGGVWFGQSAAADAPCVIVFDTTLRISGGPLAGQPLVAQFPLLMRGEIQRRCEEAIRGTHSRFTCSDGWRSRTFDAAPVLSGHQSVVCGVLIEGAAIPAPTVLGERVLGAVS